MPYLTWEYMADFVEGEKRLKDDMVRRGETAEDHPFFDEKESAVSRLVDSALESAGYEPPDEITDTALKNAAAGILVGLLTETSSKREAWMENVHKAGLAYLQRVAEGAVIVAGTVTDTEADGSTGEIHGQLVDDPMFDDPTGDSAFSRAFPPLGRPRGWSRY